MTMILLILVVCSLIALSLWAFYFYKYNNQKRQLTQIEKELGLLLKEKRKDKLLLLTDDAGIKSLLVRINQLLDLNNELEKNQKKNEASNRRMLANISHDLKTPLTVILGYAEMLENEAAVPAENAQLKLKKIKQKAQEVLVQIEEFFDVVKIEAGEFKLHLEKIDLCELCREELLGFYQRIAAEKIEMDVQIPEEAMFIKADKNALKRIFSNLIDNAIKYGNAGRYLKVHLYQKDGLRCIEIIDHGKGIVEDSQDKIFERLYTLEDSRNKKYQGSGLGLTITKRLVEEMQGTLTVNSVPYEETVFTITF